MAKNKIFEVDIAGLRQLQEGKPKWFIIRELLQNAMDEPIKSILLTMRWVAGTAFISVEDDSPTGFRNLADVYTLFGDTYKRTNPEKRGRFNFGEKQVLVMADYAEVLSTTGGYKFDIRKGIKEKVNKKRPSGSLVYVQVRMRKAEFEECVEMANLISPDPGIKFLIDVTDKEDEMGSVTLEYVRTQKHIHKSFTAKLLTEYKDGEAMRRSSRDTSVYLYDEPQSYLYEMGIPVCMIDCDYSIDVQQRVPLSTDRDTVPDSYLKTLYGEVLNATADEITKHNASSQWVRQGTESDRSSADAVKTVLRQRFGDKALIANPFDRRSMDEAISNNYNVIHGSEMSGAEWAKVKENGLLQSTSEMFRTGIAEGVFVKKDDLTPAQFACGEMAKKIAKEFLGIDLKVSYYKSPDATVIADYKDDHLRFNISHIDISKWQPAYGGFIAWWMLDLIIHELGHSAGLHYEQSYHRCITMLGAKCTIRAITDRNFFMLY